MHSNSRIQLTVTDYFLQNTAFWFKTVRISRRITVASASAYIKRGEAAITDFESGDQKEGSIDTMARLAAFYQLPVVRMAYTSVPTRHDWKELCEKGRKLGNEDRCKKIPKSGTCAAAKLYDEQWLAWGRQVMERFEERNRK